MLEVGEGTLTSQAEVPPTCNFEIDEKHQLRDIFSISGNRGVVVKEGKAQEITNKN